MSSFYGRAAKHMRSKSSKNTANNNNNADFNDSDSGDMPNMTKTTSRSRLAKALPTAPPLFGRLKTSRSSPNAGDASTTAQPPLPPLPAASSRFLSDHSYSYVPTSATTGGAPGASGAILPPRFDSAPWATSAASINSSESSLPQSPHSSSRPMPHFPHPQRPEAKELPDAPPAPPPPPSESQQQPRIQMPESNFFGMAQSTDASTAATGAAPIRRRPVAGATTSPDLDPAYPAPATVTEDQPAFDAFADLPQLPPLSPFHATMPQSSDAEAKSEYQAPTQNGLLSPYPAPEADGQEVPARITSISSIISAYSHDSYEHTGASSSNSDGTASTNNSSFMATSSPLRPLPEEKLNRSSDDQRLLKGDDGAAPLSYLLEEEYGMVEGGERRAAGGQQGNDEPPVLPAKDVNKEFQNANAEADRAFVAPPPPVKDDKVRPGPSATSLRSAPTANFAAPAAATTPDSATAKTPESTRPPLPSSPSSHSSSSKIWERRSEKTDKPISVPELKLASTAASAPALAAAAAAFKRAEPASTKSTNGNFTRDPLPPPRSPLPPPPSSRSDSSEQQQQQQSSKSPLGAGRNSSSASAIAPRVGLPGRNVRPSQQQQQQQQQQPQPSPASPSASSDMGMGRSVSKLKAKLGLKSSGKDATSSAQRLPTPEYDDKQAGGNVEAQEEVPSTTTTTTAPVNGSASQTGSQPFTFGVTPAPYQTKEVDTPRATPPPQTQTQQAPQQTQQQFAPRTSSRKASGAATAPPSNFYQEQYNPYGEDADRAISETGSQLTVRGVASTLSVENEQQQRQQLQQQQQQSYAQPAYCTTNRDASSPCTPSIFPTGYMPNAVTGNTVFAAPPPSRSQCQCIHEHENMYTDRNVNYPLSCQACQTFERTPRMRCRWCYLRVCMDCRDLLFNQAGRDVAQLMALLEARGLPAEQPPVSKEMPLLASPVAEDLPSPKLHHVFSASSMNELPVIREA